MSKFIKFKTVAKNVDFMSIDSIFLVTNNFIYYTYGDQNASLIINEDTYFDIVNQINTLDDGWVDVRDYVADKNEMSHLLVREKSIKGIVVSNSNNYELKLEHNHLPAEIAVTAMTEEDAEGLINYLSK